MPMFTAENPPTAAPSLIEALVIALDDEYRARATYGAVLAAFGPETPFERILASEERHVAALEAAFARYGLALPADRWRGRVPPPPTLADACRDGVAGEIHNIALYDRLLAQVSEPDVRAVFINLRNASANGHLPAFRACAERYAAEAEAPAPKPAPSWQPVLTGVLAGAAMVWLAGRLIGTRVSAQG
jgi:rubrerythrin